LLAVAYGLCAIVWGTTWYAIRVSIGPGGYPTFVAAALRFTVAALILWFLWMLGRVGRKPESRRQLAWLAAAGAFNTAGYALVYRAEENVPGALGAVLFGTYPLLVALVATVTRTEAVRREQMLGALISLAGVAVIFSDRMAVSIDQAIGIGLLACAVFSSACYGVIVKRHAADLGPLAAVAIFLAVTAGLLWGLAIAADPSIPWPPPTRPSLAILYLGVFGSIVAFAAYFYLLKRISLMATTTLVFIQPMVAIAVDALWEPDAVVSPRAYAGIAVTLAGVFASLWPGLRRRARARRHRP
jgi:drug/metabolite transporter (DMT)-like permease